MITRCNQCGTKFEISAELVQSDDPSVRCGECLSVFDARAQLVGGDSIQNYSSVSAGRQAARRQHRRPAAAEAAQQQTSPVVSHAGTADQYAHISEDDMENAATVVLDQTLSSDNNPAAARQRSAAGDRINDGFYSPDIGVGRLDNQHPGAEPNRPGRADSKIDPSISVDEGLDSTSLEFERTLAIENYSSQSIDDVHRMINDQNEGISNDLGVIHDPEIDRVTANNHQNRTQPPTQNFTDTEWQSDTKHLSAGHNSHVASDPVTTATTGRDYPPINEEFLAGQSESFEQLSRTADPDRHLLPEDPGMQQNNDSSELIEQNPSFSATNDDHSSASELRRYVGSRGGKVVAGSDAGQRRKSRRSTSMLTPLLLVGLLTLGALYISRDTIATMNLPEPVLSAFCGITGCELPMQKDVEQLELVRHQMSSHKILDNVLVFTVDLINRARFPQPYPSLVVTMANNDGASVAFRKFEPDEYLEEDPALKRLPAGKPVRIKFEIVDPGPEALSSELSFE